jgi:hypothetical protein
MPDELPPPVTKDEMYQAAILDELRGLRVDLAQARAERANTRPVAEEPVVLTGVQKPGKRRR